MVYFLVTITLCLLLIFIFSELAYKLKIPLVIAQISAGVIIGIPSIRKFVIGDNMDLINVLSDLGIIFLLFLAGLEVEKNKLYGARRDVLLIGIFSSIVPLALGFLVMRLLGYSNVVALIVGISMSITSEGAKTKELIEIGKIKSRLGSIMIGAGIIDYCIGLVMFVVASMISGYTIISVDLVKTPLELGLFIIIVWIVFKSLPRLIAYEEKETKEVREVSMFMTVLLLCLGFAIMGVVISGTLTGAIIAAFVAGIVIQLSMKAKEEHMIKSHFEILALSFIVPFFFIGTGLSFDIGSLIVNIPLLVIIITVGILGKIWGVLLTKPFVKDLSSKQLHLIGWSMNSRGTVDLVIALIALKVGFISASIYSAILIMALFTTLLFPFILKAMIKMHPRIMR